MVFLSPASCATTTLLALILPLRALLLPVESFGPRKPLLLSQWLRMLPTGASVRGQLPTFRHCSGRRIDPSFDFSCALRWEQYYQEQRTSKDDGIVEWHSSIPLDVLATYCRDCDWDRPIHNVDEAFRVLMIGCGTSRLPEAVLERGPATSITLLDSSATCIEELTQRYKRLESVSCICGDAVKLTNTLSLSQKYQVIVDKGLLDALLCGEGWNGPVATLLDEACKVLSSNGVYLLVSYRLPVSTKEFMTNIGRQIGLTWEFDCEGSNDRVGISVAKKSSYTESAGARLPAPVAPAMRCW